MACCNIVSFVCRFKLYAIISGEYYAYNTIVDYIVTQNYKRD